MNATSMYNLTDDELIRYVDRTNPEIEELCARFEEMIQLLDEANHFSSILVTRLEEAKAEIALPAFSEDEWSRITKAFAHLARLNPKADQEKK